MAIEFSPTAATTLPGSVSNAISDCADVDRAAGVDLYEWPEAEWRVVRVVPKLVGCSFLVVVSGVTITDAPPVSSLDDLSWTATTDLDERWSQSLQRRHAVRVERAVQNGARRGVGNHQHRHHRGASEPLTIRNRLRQAEYVHQRLLDLVLGDQGKLKLLRQRRSERRTFRARRPRDRLVLTPASLSHLTGTPA
jgi:hypothetical protein